MQYGYGAEARKELAELSENSGIHLHIVDMSKPRDIAKFIKEFKEGNEKLDVLINNAGCMVNTRELTEDQLEKNFATNTLGTFLITSGMMKQLNVDDLQFEKMSPFDGTMAYAQNKRQQVVMTEHLAREHTEVHFSVMHPGWADTPAVRNSMPDFYEKMKDKLRTVSQGADTVVWLAVAKDPVTKPSGLFWQDRSSVSTHLPLAWSRTSRQEEDRLMSHLRTLEE